MRSRRSYAKIPSIQPLTSGNFGLLIAYVLPGFTALWGASYFSETLRTWLVGAAPDPPTLGGFLYVTLGSVAAGLTVSTVRWAVLDTIHHSTGIPKPQWDFSRFAEHVSAYQLLTEIHYRYYQAYGNGLIALTFAYLAKRAATGLFTAPVGLIDLTVLLVAIVFFLGSRDTLRKYYARVAQTVREGRS